MTKRKMPYLKLEMLEETDCISKTKFENKVTKEIDFATYYKVKATSVGGISHGCKAYLHSVETLRLRNGLEFVSIWEHENAPVLWANKGKPDARSPIDIHPDIPEYVTAFFKLEKCKSLYFDFCISLYRYINFSINKFGIYKLTFIVSYIDNASSSKIEIIVDYNEDSITVSGGG